MLFYGDRAEAVAPAARLGVLARDEGRFLDHDALRRRFIALAGLTQGVADADHAAFGRDRFRPAEAGLLDALTLLGGLLMHSWDRGCTGAVVPPIGDVADLPATVTVRQAEGHAFYALYPEAYGLSARMLKLKGEPRIIGLRSIGTGLGAMVAASLGSPRPVTLRPGGDPFARSLCIDPALADSLIAGDPHFVIVDEGPGLSGSSFGCVADWLAEQGVAEDRIAFLPGHSGGLGPEASARHRQRWAGVQRPVARIDRIRTWIEQVVGPIDRWDDCSGGDWRPLWSASEADWPAVTPMWERSKFLVRSGGKQWLVRFAGLGEEGPEKLALAMLLQRAGVGPEVAGLTHGWLVMRWHEDAVPGQPGIEELGAYLRLRSFMPDRQGASLHELVSMVRRNAPGFARWDPPLAELETEVRPVKVDGKLQPHEWLRLPGGRLLKADALDHHQGHDLVGCQDPGWDVAGAAVELNLSRSEIAALVEALGVDPALAAFYRVAYAAFRLGAHRLSETMVGAAEAARHAAAARRYELALVDAIEQARDVDQALGLGVEALA